MRSVCGAFCVFERNDFGEYFQGLAHIGIHRMHLNKLINLTLVERHSCEGMYYAMLRVYDFSCFVVVQNNILNVEGNCVHNMIIQYQ